MSLASLTFQSCQKEDPPQPTNQTSNNNNPTPQDTLYKFVLVEYTTGTNDASNLKFETTNGTPSCSSAIPFTVTELPLIGVTSTGNLYQDVQAFLTINPPGVEDSHVFHSQTLTSIPIDIIVYNLSCTQLSNSRYWPGGGCGPGTADNYLTDICRITSGTATNPVVTWFIRI
ncbi:MAG: hypothetical protein KatS3mg035_0989 [Bacteroidia bacterium]|nr:MAG: hypothetical protein KatS3mg035_0989 [Bacteroidia bacterium]